MPSHAPWLPAAPAAEQPAGIAILHLATPRRRDAVDGKAELCRQLDFASTVELERLDRRAVAGRPQLPDAERHGNLLGQFSPQRSAGNCLDCHAVELIAEIRIGRPRRTKQPAARPAGQQQAARRVRILAGGVEREPGPQAAAMPQQTRAGASGKRRRDPRPKLAESSRQRQHGLRLEHQGQGRDEGLGQRGQVKALGAANRAHTCPRPPPTVGEESRPVARQNPQGGGGKGTRSHHSGAVPTERGARSRAATAAASVHM